jgi:predicted nucleic acid-binding protein
MDERRGRAIAARLGLKYIGLLGVLVAAKQKGIITSIKPALDELITKAGFWITKDLYARLLSTVGE